MTVCDVKTPWWMCQHATAVVLQKAALPRAHPVKIRTQKNKNRLGWPQPLLKSQIRLLQCVWCDTNRIAAKMRMYVHTAAAKHTVDTEPWWNFNRQGNWLMMLWGVKEDERTTQTRRHDVCVYVFCVKLRLSVYDVVGGVACRNCVVQFRCYNDNQITRELDIQPSRWLYE